jgi:hypothetical protein
MQNAAMETMIMAGMRAIDRGMDVLPAAQPTTALPEGEG